VSGPVSAAKGQPRGRRALRPRGKLMAEDTRRHHRALVLQHLFRVGPASRADLARTSGLTRVTISDLVAGLLEDGLVEELGAPVGSRVGKPPILVGLVPDASHILTVDLLPDDRMAGAVLNLAGEVKARENLPLEGRTGDDAVMLLRELLRLLRKATDRPILGVGIGSPGVVSAEGVVIDAPNRGWRDLDLAGLLSGELGLPVFVANDANTAVLGEHTFGDAEEAGLLLVRVGAGVGAGLIVEGVLVQGHRYAAGELGHVQVDPNGADCACGRRGCLETVVAAPRLRARMAGTTATEAERRLADAGAVLGGILAPVVGTLNLHELVLAGPTELLDGALREAVDRTIRDRIMPVSADGLVVRTSTLGDDVGLMGAAVLVLSGVLGVS
jgi:predicted NBD/HSP70 family sugar kinase